MKENKDKYKKPELKIISLKTDDMITTGQLTGTSKITFGINVIPELHNISYY